MARWAQRPEFKRLAGTLAASHGHDFERAVLPLLRVVAPTLAVRFRDSLPEEVRRRRVDALIRLVEEDNYHRFYGDIPRRPLFLRYILETVSEYGIHGVDRRALLFDWVSLKIRRDVADPMRGGGPGRMPITSDQEGVDATVALSFRIMRRAATLMTQIHDGQLELLPSCAEEMLLGAFRALERVTDTTGLVLHSLLVPVETASAAAESRLRFAHQVHHELFLALEIEHDPAAYAGIGLPPGVAEWLQRA
jgi:hypothetical protein